MGGLSMQMSKRTIEDKNITQRVNEYLGTDYKGLITEEQWKEISKYQKLSEDFIREFQDMVVWNCISGSQKLSESFIREFQNKVCWGWISMYQKLSESFIRDFQNDACWRGISEYQKLSEDFIREFQNNVDWDCISKFQNLSESFIRDFQDRVDWYWISRYQKLSELFIREFKDRLHIIEIKDSWHYKTTEEKKQAVIATGLYECHDTYFLAYKGIRSDRYSNYNFQYKYEKGGIYESWCDCSNDENSFGLSVWDEPNAREYCNKLVVRVKVNYEDVGRVVHDGGKIRCFKIKILE